MFVVVCQVGKDIVSTTCWAASSRNPPSSLCGSYELQLRKHILGIFYSRSNLNISVENKITYKIINEQYQFCSICFHGKFLS